MSESNLSTERDSGSGPALPTGVDRVFGDLRGKTDGDLLALCYCGADALRSIEEGGVLRKIDASTGQLLDVLSLSDLENCWAFRPDGNLLASGADGISLWDVETGNLLDRLHEPSWALTLAFSPNGELLASGHDDYHVRIWEVATGKLLHRLSGHSNEVSALAFSADTTQLASAGEDRQVILWDVATGRQVQKLEGHTDRVDAIAWSPDGSRIASAGWDTAARIWDPASGELLALLNGQGECVHAACFIEDQDRLVTADSEGKVRVWDYHKLKVLGLLDRHRAAVHCLAVSPNGKQLATGGDDRSIHLWNLVDYSPITEASANPTPVTAVCVCESKLAALHQDGGVTSWDLSTSFWSASSKAEDGRFRAITADQNAKIVLGDDRGQVKVFDSDLGKMLANWTVCDGPVRRLAVSNQGNLLASTAGLDGTVKLWNLDNGEPTLIIPQAVANCSIEDVAFDPTGHLLAVAGIDWLKSSGEDDGAVTVWDLQSRKAHYSLPGGALRIGFSPDGKLLAAITAQRSVVVWNLVNKEIIQELGQEECFFTCLAFSPDGKYFVVGSEQNYLRFWDTDTWTVRLAMDLETTINELFFPPGLPAVITGNGNSTCYLVRCDVLS